MQTKRFRNTTLITTPAQPGARDWLSEAGCGGLNPWIVGCLEQLGHLCRNASITCTPAARKKAQRATSTAGLRAYMPTACKTHRTPVSPIKNHVTMTLIESARIWPTFGYSEGIILVKSKRRLRARRCERPLLAEPGRSAQHSRSPGPKNRGLSRRTGSDPKQPFNSAIQMTAELCLAIRVSAP